MKKVYYLIILYLLLVPLNIFAANENSDVWSGTNKYICTSKYQDSSISTSDIAYFSYCMKAICNNNNYSLEYFYDSNELKNNNMIVSCTNGNKNPYAELYKNGCTNLDRCNINDSGGVKYCSVIFKYDCNKKSDGTSFTTTTKTTTSKKTTSKKTKTTETTNTTVVPVSTKLSSLTLSKGTILFNKDIFEYSINLKEEDTSIDVTAIPEDNKCTVQVSDNVNIVDGSVIKVEVKAPTGESSIYKINVKKEIKLSSNANLKNLTVSNYPIDFNNKISSYTLIIDNDETFLDINYETEDSTAKVNIENNNDLQDGSKITINVIAEDGTTKYYYIDIIKEEKSSSNLLTIIFIIILILAIIAGAYYLYIKFIANKRGDKYEYE